MRKRRTVPQIEKDTEIKVLKRILRETKEELKGLEKELKTERKENPEEDDWKNRFNDIYNKMHGFKMTIHSMECDLERLGVKV